MGCVAIFQQNANKCFFFVCVCVTNSRNIIPLFHKRLFDETKIKLNRLSLLKKILIQYN